MLEFHFVPQILFVYTCVNLWLSIYKPIWNHSSQYFIGSSVYFRGQRSGSWKQYNSEKLIILWYMLNYFITILRLSKIQTDSIPIEAEYSKSHFLQILNFCFMDKLDTLNLFYLMQDVLCMETPNEKIYHRAQKRKFLFTWFPSLHHMHGIKVYRYHTMCIHY